MSFWWNGDGVDGNQLFKEYKDVTMERAQQFSSNAGPVLLLMCHLGSSGRGHVNNPRSFVDSTLWPEYLALQEALHSHLNEATERIIREEVYQDIGEAAERAG